MSQFIEMFKECQQMEKLSSLCNTFIDGDWIESKDQSDNGIRLVQTGNVGNGFFKDKEDKSRFISDETFERLHCTEIFPGDILVSRLPDPIGRACLIPNGLGRMITAVDCSILRLKNTILPEFFIAYTMTSTYSAKINELATGTTRRRISRGNLGKIVIPIPPMEQQKQFVSIVRQADKSKFADFKSQFIEMFEGKGYPLVKLESFAVISTGSTPTKSRAEYWGGTKPWVSAEDMKHKHVSHTSLGLTDLGYSICKHLPVNSLMYVCRGSIGVMAINKIECATNQSICTATCKEEMCNVEYLYHALLYKREIIKQMGTGTSFKSLNQSTFSALEVILPPMDLQQQFVTIAEQADKSKSHVLKTLKEIELTLQYNIRQVA